MTATTDRFRATLMDLGILGNINLAALREKVAAEAMDA